LRSITEPPLEVPLNILVSQAAKEIVAAEKIQALELKRKELPKAASDRNRKDTRIVT
jgi:hypothetical protein